MQAVAEQSANADAVDVVVAGASRSQLARDLGLDRAYVSRILSKNQTPSLDVAARLARVLGVSLDRLYAYLTAN